MHLNAEQKEVTAFIAAAFLLAAIAGIYTGQLLLNLKVASIVAFAIFLPGYLASLLAADQMDIVRRFALSFALGFSLVPMYVYYLGKSGILMDARSSHMIFFSVYLLLGACLYIKQGRSKKLPDNG